MKKNKYEAQALAIAMIVLVVCSIIGMSIYSRVSKDKSLAIKEQASAEALEISDLILDYMIQVPIENVITTVGDANLVSGASYEESASTEDITGLFTQLGIDDFDSTSLGLCSVQEGSSNEYNLNVGIADENSFFEIRPGHVRSFLVGDLGLPGTCLANITFETRGESGTGFSVSKIYKLVGDPDKDTVKPYEYNDVTSYCFGDGATSCNNEDNFQGSWESFESGGTQVIAFSESVDYGGSSYYLDEVRIKAVAGTVAMAYSLQDCGDDEGLRLINIQATSNCSGVYRGKGILVPETQWSSPIFDYVIFNGEGRI